MNYKTSISISAGFILILLINYASAQNNNIEFGDKQGDPAMCYGSVTIEAYKGEIIEITVDDNKLFYYGKVTVEGNSRNFVMKYIAGVIVGNEIIGYEANLVVKADMKNAIEDYYFGGASIPNKIFIGTGMYSARSDLPQFYIARQLFCDPGFTRRDSDNGKLCGTGSDIPPITIGTHSYSLIFTRKSHVQNKLLVLLEHNDIRVQYESRYGDIITFDLDGRIGQFVSRKIKKEDYD